MIRFILRLCGYGLVAIGFTSLIMDGTSSIAAGVLKLTSLGDGLAQALPDRLVQLRRFVETSFGQAFWDAGFLQFFALPGFGVLMVLGLLLVLLGRRPKTPIGFLPMQ